ncbi:MAG TPA: hemerythrin domain-containing protein [Methanoculleus sp.]|jgi:hemerythrin superfamily protein|nr:hemerythrin domain-containing protein [Methanoculleus sp.]
MPQILELIEDDHDLIRVLFDEIEHDPDSRDVRCITLHRELLAHLLAEEATLYPRLREAAPEEVEMALDEHVTIRERLERFKVVPEGDEAWIEALDDLRDWVEAHFAQEEEDIFARARHYLSRSDLFALGEAFEKEKVTVA